MRLPPAQATTSPQAYLSWVEQVLGEPGAVPSELLQRRFDVELCLRRDAGPAEQWHVQLDHGTASVHQGPSPAPTCIVKMHIDDFGDLLRGYLRPQAALVDGRLSISGDAALAVSLVPLLLPQADSLSEETERR